MRYRDRGKLFATVLVAICLAALASGCGREITTTPIKAVPASQDQADFGLGPGVRPLSSGPGDKSSPSWSPDDGRVAFVIDGYVVDKPLYIQDLRRWTTKDFGATEVRWRTREALTIFAQEKSSDKDASGSLYRTLPSPSFDVKEMASGALTMDSEPGEKGLIAALETSRYESGLARFGGDGKMDQVYTNLVGGRVTGLSLSPDGEKIVIAARGAATAAIHVLDLTTGASSTITRLEPGWEIHGAPQWTRRGIYYAAGPKDKTGEGSALDHLYHIPPSASAPEPAPGVGEDFVAASLRASPDGKRLAIVGRRNPTSSANVYMLDLEKDDLKAVTANEDMEIKTSPDDLAWSNSGDRVAIVARGAISGPRVLSGSASALLADFYNLYEVPVGASGGSSS